MMSSTIEQPKGDNVIYNTILQPKGDAITYNNKS